MKIDTFADRLKKALRDKGMSAAELSRLTDTPESVISQYKKGLYEPKQSRLERFSNVLGVSVPWLMGYDAPHFDERDGSSADNVLSDLLNASGCSFAGEDGVDSRLMVTPDGFVWISDRELNDLRENAVSFLRFQIHELARRKGGYLPLDYEFDGDLADRSLKGLPIDDYKI